MQPPDSLLALWDLLIKNVPASSRSSRPAFESAHSTSFTTSQVMNTAAKSSPIRRLLGRITVLIVVQPLSSMHTTFFWSSFVRNQGTLDALSCLCKQSFTHRCATA